MKITASTTDGTCEILLHGRLTFSDHAPAHELLQTIAGDGMRAVILDLTGMEFIDSAGLGMLLLARDEAEKHGMRFSVRGISGEVRRMFEIACVHELFCMS